jgi:hypothetical protein
MVFLWGVLSMAAPVLALASSGLVAAAIVERDLSVVLLPGSRVKMVVAGVLGYMASGGIGFTVDAALRTPLISYAFIYAVVMSSLIVGAAIIRWMVTVPTKLTSFDQTSLRSERLSS